MIPKIIHYCWFGKQAIPVKLQKCIASWEEKMPEFQLMRWDESSFDIDSNVWTKQAYKMGKFAFVSDYVRLKALYEFGGIYLDTDVMVKKSLDDFLEYKAFTGFESNDKLTSAVIGAEKEFPLIGEFLEFYSGKNFLLEDGSLNNIANVIMMTEICQKYGLKPDNTYQVIHDMHIFPKTYFCPLDFWKNRDFTDNTYTIHYFDASWLDPKTKKRIEKERKEINKIKNKLLLISSNIIHALKDRDQG